MTSRRGVDPKPWEGPTEISLPPLGLLNLCVFLEKYDTSGLHRGVDPRAKRVCERIAGDHVGPQNHCFSFEKALILASQGGSILEPNVSDGELPGIILDLRIIAFPMKMQAFSLPIGGPF